MKPDLVPHEERHVVLWGQASVMDVTLLLVMIDGALLVNLDLDTPCLLLVGLETRSP
jgi:hypothetical protein